MNVLISSDAAPQPKAEIRRPKAESRRKAEARKADAGAMNVSINGFNGAQFRSNSPACFPASDFGLRPSFGLRISTFGLITFPRP